MSRGQMMTDGESIYGDELTREEIIISQRRQIALLKIQNMALLERNSRLEASNKLMVHYFNRIQLRRDDTWQ